MKGGSDTLMKLNYMLGNDKEVSPIQTQDSTFVLLLISTNRKK